MELLSQGDIAVHLHAPLHMRRDQVPPAFDDLDEILLLAADRAVGVVLGLLDIDAAIVHGHEPASHLENVEQIGPVNAAQERLVSLHPVNVEDVLRRMWDMLRAKGSQQRPGRSAVASGNPEWNAEEFVLSRSDA